MKKIVIKMLKIYKPTMEQRKIIEYILQEFEKEHSKDKTSKGKILIKEEYKKRW